MILRKVCAPQIFQLCKMSTNLLVHSKNKTLKNLVELLVQNNYYTVYEVTDTVLRTNHWHKSCALLITHGVTSDKLNVCEGYLKKGGKLLFVSEIEEHTSLQPNCRNLLVQPDEWNNPESLLTKFQEALRSLDICTSQDRVPTERNKSSHLHLFTDSSPLIILSGFDESLRSMMVFRGEPCAFNSFRFMEALRTREFGRSLVFGEVVTSTMEVADKIGTRTNGITVVAHVQLQGQGRSGNKWISPLGAALFTVKLVKRKSSSLFSRLPLLQHAAALAVVLAVKKQPGCEGFPITVKWPNDVYIGGLKVGGLLARSSIIGDVFSCSIGIGVNLDNDAPVVSVNSLLLKNGLSKLELEPFIAEVLNQLENIVYELEDKPLTCFKHLYYQHWMHRDTTVTVQCEDGVEVIGKVSGIDDSGYLVVRTEEGIEKTVHPDGNSFDIMAGLIVPKFRP